MIELFYWTTPNGHKITILLEELGLPYTIRPVNISRGEQFAPEFLAISPSNKIPAIIDHAPADGGPPLSVFESGVILQYLAEKTGRFLPIELRARKVVLEWLLWQMSEQGPMLGQNHHFRLYAPEKLPYAIERYTKEAERLYDVLDRRLKDRAFVADEYSIADMAIYPWVVPHERQGIDLDEFPHVQRWFQALRARDAIQRAYAKADEINTAPTITEESRAILFGQGRLKPQG
ncbi:MAG TPA: glutathione S-transferase N-terminal domain-containing protein [Candidatus Competibacteraceae bacterium]|nr:glutathione S-transferase N-terminal domain-containing protein [Candidatus Competibacteraceae bacterium]